MRFIDTTSIIVPNDWLLKAKLHYGNTYSSLWSYFKEDFEKIVGKKCWYSESCNGGSVNPIDHFRPQANSVKVFTDLNADLDPIIWAALDCSSRNGYDYLKFDFSNFRYSCDISNSLNFVGNIKAKGKTNFFPLKAGSPYANSVLTLGVEQHCLLDPCDKKDPSYFTFNDLGLIEPHVSLLDTSWEFCRVKVSIEIYNLHYYDFVDDRKITWDICREHIELADALYHKKRKSNQERDNLTYHIKETVRMTKKDYEFSAVAIDCISFYKEKKKIEWLENFIPNAVLVK